MLCFVAGFSCFSGEKGEMNSTWGEREEIRVQCEQAGLGISHSVTHVVQMRGEGEETERSRERN